MQCKLFLRDVSRRVSATVAENGDCRGIVAEFGRQCGQGLSVEHRRITFRGRSGVIGAYYRKGSLGRNW